MSVNRLLNEAFNSDELDSKDSERYIYSITYNALTNSIRDYIDGNVFATTLITHILCVYKLVLRRSEVIHIINRLDVEIDKSKWYEYSEVYDKSYCCYKDKANLTKKYVDAIIYVGYIKYIDKYERTKI